MWTPYGGFDSHSFCARCRDKGKGKDPCIENPQCTSSAIYSLQSNAPNFQPLHIRFKKEKREARKETLTTPSKDWLCRKLSKLNLTLVEGYPSQSSEAGSLLKDQFLRTAKSQAKWYRLYSDHKVDSTAVSSWNTDTSHLNSSYSRIARQARSASTPPMSRHISQENLQKWEATVISNQAASFNRCVFKVQQDMQAQLKTIRTESKGKGSSKVSAATDELQYLMDFNSSITQAVAKTMEHLTDFVFVSMGNLTLARRESYLTRKVWH